MYIIWHDNDYDLALWVYENSNLHREDVRFRKIPKTNSPNDLLTTLKSKEDFQILPIIKFATPDIIIQKINKESSEILLSTEFMTHTPHHDHIFQRFERVYCIAREGIPMSLVLMDKKVKIERGSKKNYKPTSYSPSNLTVHTYLKTSLISKLPILMFFWPTIEGFPIMDKKHPTAPAIKSDIIDWINRLNLKITTNSDKEIFNPVTFMQYQKYLHKYKFANGKNFEEITYEELVQNINHFYSKLVRIKVESTKYVISKYKIDISKTCPDFETLEKTIVFSYKSRDFRTDPYAGFLCGMKNLFVYDNTGEKRANLILIPDGIKYSDISKNPLKGFHDFPEDLRICPLHSLSNISMTSYEDVVKHINSGCVYTLSKQQRIFGTVSDVIIFKDYIYYNQHHVN